MPENSRRSYSPRRSNNSKQSEEGSNKRDASSTTPNTKKDGGYNNRRTFSGSKKDRKFTGRCRLFVGNLGDCTEDEMKEMFSKYGEVAEIFVNKDKGFGFIRFVSVHEKSIFIQMFPFYYSEKFIFSVYIGFKVS